jgi:hypothetical protein
MRYRSKAEIEAMQWSPKNRTANNLQDTAADIILWVKANGGEALYKPPELFNVVVESKGQRLPISERALIIIRTSNGWKPALPDDYIVKGEVWFHSNGTPCDGKNCLPGAKQILEFYPRRPDAFEKEWVAL